MVEAIKLMFYNRALTFKKLPELYFEKILLPSMLLRIKEAYAPFTWFTLPSKDKTFPLYFVLLYPDVIIILIVSYYSKIVLDSALKEYEITCFLLPLVVLKELNRPQFTGCLLHQPSFDDK